MSTLRAGDREFHTLAIGQVLTATAAAASAGVVRQYPQSSMDALQPATVISAGATVTVGPFTGSVVLGVECSAGTVAWSAGVPAPASDWSGPQTAAGQALVSDAGILSTWPMTLPYVMAAPPTLSLGVANAATSIATATDRLPDEAGAFTYLGGPFITQGGSFRIMGNWPSNTAIIGHGLVEFWADISEATGRFEVLIRGTTALANNGCRVAIQQKDGSWAYASAGASFAPGVSDNNTYRGLVTLGAAGLYKIRLEFAAANAFSGVAMLPADSCRATPKPRLRYLLVTDSYGTVVSDSGTQMSSTDSFAAKLRWLTDYDIVVAAASACGWVQKSGGALLKVNEYLANCINKALEAGPLDGVIFAHGYNDYTGAQTAAAVISEVNTAISTCQQLLPNKALIAVSPWVVKTLGGASVQRVLEMRDAMKAAFLAAGGKFVDLLSLKPNEYVPAWQDAMLADSLAAATTIQVQTAPSLYGPSGTQAGRTGWWVYIQDGINSEMRQVSNMGTTDPRTLTVAALTYAHAAGTPVYLAGPQYITGTGRQGATVGDGTADRYIGTDAVHPTVAGHAALARAVAGQLGRVIVES